MHVAIVIPVHNGAGLIRDCVAALRPDRLDEPVEIVLVDDGSTDQTAAVARATGVRVIELEEHRGPYHARNVGWRSTEADLIVFTDMRCRAEPGWLRALLEPFADPGVMVVGGEITTTAGDSVAERWAVKHQLLSLATHLEEPYYLPYVTTASMAVRRSALDAVDGFVEVRSGGDVDICWRIQYAGLGSVVGAYDARMAMVPRSSAREVLRQWNRFANGHLELHIRHPNRGEPPDPIVAWRQAGIALKAIVRVVLRPEGDLPVKALDELRLAVYRRAYLRAWKRLHAAGKLPIGTTQPGDASGSDDDSPNTART